MWSWTVLVLGAHTRTASPPPTPPALPNHVLELDGCPTTHEVLADLRVTVSDATLTDDEVATRVREALHANLNANGGVTVPLHNVVVATDTQAGANRPPLPPRPPDAPQSPTAPPPIPSTPPAPASPPSCPSNVLGHTQPGFFGNEYTARTINTIDATNGLTFSVRINGTVANTFTFATAGTNIPPQNYPTKGAFLLQTNNAFFANVVGVGYGTYSFTLADPMVVTVVFTSNTMYVYRSGTLQLTLTNPNFGGGMTTSGYYMHIGNTKTFDNTKDPGVDFSEVRVYNSSLTSGEVAACASDSTEYCFPETTDGYNEGYGRCDETGGRRIVFVGSSLTYAQCKTACDNDSGCTAFDRGTANRTASSSCQIFNVCRRWLPPDGYEYPAYRYYVQCV